MDKLRRLIVEYMQEQKLMQLATISEDGPWICSVWQAFDNDLNIYFFSATNRKHSLDIEKDSRVAGALAKPHDINDAPRAVQFSGIAKRLINAEDIAKARSVFEGRIFNSETIDKLMANSERPHVFYKIVPNKFVLFDVKNYPENSRREYNPATLTGIKIKK
ncbi:MAG: pyridoxamine 5'-phosphate oxidase family protein [Candidatus Saccharimonadales bacterium]